MPHAWILLLVYLGTLVLSFTWHASWTAADKRTPWTTAWQYFLSDPLTHIIKFFLLPLCLWFVIWDDPALVGQGIAMSGLEYKFGFKTMLAVAILLGMASDKISDVIFIAGKAVYSWVQGKIQGIFHTQP